MLQHNPHNHSISCPAAGVTLDGFQTRELDEEPRACAGCQCSLALPDPKPPAAEAQAPAEALVPVEGPPEAEGD